MIVFLCSSGLGYPNGMAPTGRVISYCQGLLHAGSRVWVLCLGTSEIPELGIHNTAVRGVENGVEFEYTCGTPIRGETFLKRRWLAFKGPLVAAWRVITRSRKERIDALVLYPDTLLTAILFWMVSRLCRAVYLLEKGEQPFLQAERSQVWKLYGFFYVRTIFKLFDGAIVISEFLERYMHKYMRSGAKTLRLPILVDVEKFGCEDKKPLPLEKYITYCGTLNETKDGVHTLMRAFALIKEGFKDVSLCLVGDSYHKTQVPLFRQHAEALGITQQVIFTGRVSRDRLPSYLCQATILALARPSSLQAEAGFSSKLGEYLATGNPVVITRTGEIEKYLEDGESAYLAPPDDVQAFAQCLHRALSHPEQASKVGQNGRKVAMSKFDYRVNTVKLQEFILSMQRK
jgi:glycosyltransferase involved in cell wall biosynthesis